MSKTLIVKREYGTFLPKDIESIALDSAKEELARRLFMELWRTRENTVVCIDCSKKTSVFEPITTIYLSASLYPVKYKEITVGRDYPPVTAFYDRPPRKASFLEKLRYLFGWSK